MVKRVCPRSHPDTCPGVILLKGNRATKEEVWGVLALHLWRAYGAHHQRFHERKIPEVPAGGQSDPAQFEFPWGPGARAKTTKTQALESLTKIHGTDSSSFPSQYEGALHDEESPSQDFRQGCLSFHGHFQFLAACPTPGEVRESFLMHWSKRRFLFTEFRAKMELKGTQYICLFIPISYV